MAVEEKIKQGISPEERRAVQAARDSRDRERESRRRWAGIVCRDFVPGFGFCRANLAQNSRVHFVLRMVNLFCGKWGSRLASGRIL